MLLNSIRCTTLSVRVTRPVRSTVFLLFKRDHRSRLFCRIDPQIRLFIVSYWILFPLFIIVITGRVRSLIDPSLYRVIRVVRYRFSSLNVSFFFFLLFLPLLLLLAVLLLHLRVVESIFRWIPTPLFRRPNFVLHVSSLFYQSVLS